MFHNNISYAERVNDKNIKKNILTPSHPLYITRYDTQVAKNQSATNFESVLCNMVPIYIALL